MQTFALYDLQRLERKLAEPLDLEREAWEAVRHRYVIADGEAHKVPAVGGASNFTGTVVETLYANGSAGNNLATFTTEATMYAAAQAEAILPASFFDPTYGMNKTLRVTLRGVYSTTATPTFTLGFRQDTVSGGIWGSSLAITAQSSVTNLVWELEFDVIAGTANLFASAHNEITVVTAGLVSGVSTGSNGFANASAIGTQTPTTAFTITTTDASHYLVPTITCGTSSASNKWQMLQMVVQGLN